MRLEAGTWKGILLAGAFALAPTGVVAQQVSGAAGIEQLRELLNPHGWGVDRAADGSLLLYPGRREESAGVPSGAPDAGLARLEEMLSPHGWQVRQQDDGSVELIPSPVQQPEQMEAALPTDSTPVSARDLETLEAALRARGWKVERDPAGDLKLYPPQGPGGPRVADTAPSRAPDPWVPPLVGEDSIPLPLTNVDDARRLARAWLLDRGTPGLAVGRIRSINRVYVASIVQNRSPFRLHEQIVIRKRDGRLLIVH